MYCSRTRSHGTYVMLTASAVVGVHVKAPVVALKVALSGRLDSSVNVTMSSSASDVVTVNVASVSTVTLNTESTMIFGLVLAEI